MEVSYRRFCHPCPLVVPKLDTADADYAFAACALSSSVRTAEKREASWLFHVSLILFSIVFFFFFPPKWDPSRTPTWPETHRVQSSRVSSHFGASESFWVRWTGGSGKEWVREGGGTFQEEMQSVHCALMQKWFGMQQRNGYNEWTVSLREDEFCLLVCSSVLNSKAIDIATRLPPFFFFLLF